MKIGMRVQIPAYTDRWMMGDRFGVVTKLPTRQMDKPVVWVKLDKSGKTFKFIARDCEEI